MSYMFSAALQSAVYQRLVNDTALGALVGSEIYDAPLEAKAKDIALEHVTIGEETARPFNTMTSAGAVHDFEVTVHSARDGFDRAKRIASAICGALVDVPLPLSEGRLVALRFLRAKAERGKAPEKRKISMRFRAVLDQDT